MIWIMMAKTFTTSVTFSQDKLEIVTTHPRVILSKEAELSLQFLFLEKEDAGKHRSIFYRVFKLSGKRYQYSPGKTAIHPKSRFTLVWQASVNVKANEFTLQMSKNITCKLLQIRL